MKTFFQVVDTRNYDLDAQQKLEHDESKPFCVAKVSYQTNNILDIKSRHETKRKATVACGNAMRASLKISWQNK